MASGRIPQDFGALWWAETKNITLEDFDDPPFEINRVVLGRWSGSTANRPSGTSSSGFFLYFSTSATYAIELAVNITTADKLFIRRKYSGTWGSWKEFTAS